MDNIREKLVELIESAREHCNNTVCGVDCRYTSEPFRCISILTADHLIANGVTIKGVENDTVKLVTDCHQFGEWIPVTERLPQQSEVVLVAAKGIKPFSTWYSYDLGKWMCCGWIVVTHWMPLPTPPKGE